MQVLVLGSHGQVGRELMLVPSKSWEVVGLGHAELDIGDEVAVRSTIARRRPDMVINAAAYTAVDRAESEREQAFAVNALAPGFIAAACADAGAALIHYSTDYVFDGTKPTPNLENDPLRPLGVYGESKAAGERAVRAALPRHVIIRTGWVYGAFGANFVKTMLRIAGERDELRVVADQFGCPTAADDIAAATMAITRRIFEGTGAWGTIHYAGAGRTSWHEFAVAIIDSAEISTGRRPVVRAISTAEYPTQARRPVNAVLGCAAIESAFGIVGAPWRDSLARTLARIFSNPAKVGNSA
jgi:dTDP-4-dehydrorhamnose reductase